MSTGDATSMFTSPANGTGRPAIVIFTAILNLLTAFFAYLAAALIFVLGLLSAVLGLQQYAVAHADKMIPMINWPLGVSLLIGLAVTAIASYATLYLLLWLG